ncbi:MAG: hypothetical protein K1X83_09775 [Oligoflexia bacterium]|nr:hypothetical protein [Oligoflexia bacterium]
MVAVRINGEDAPIKSEGAARMSDLIELIKNWIDPEHMITKLLIDGKDLADEDWTSALTKYGTTTILEVETGTPESFVAERLSTASEIVREAYMQFREARKSFQDGSMQVGNQKLLMAVNTLQAFFEWYGTLVELIPEADRAKHDLSPQVREITEICKRICQQQLYQSWWALGEAIQNELEPKLDQLEDVCRRFKATN